MAFEILEVEEITEEVFSSLVMWFQQTRKIQKWKMRGNNLSTLSVFISKQGKNTDSFSNLFLVCVLRHMEKCIELKCTCSFGQGC